MRERLLHNVNMLNAPALDCEWLRWDILCCAKKDAVEGGEQADEGYRASCSKSIFFIAEIAYNNF